MAVFTPDLPIIPNNDSWITKTVKVVHIPDPTNQSD